MSEHPACTCQEMPFWACVAHAYLASDNELAWYTERDSSWVNLQGRRVDTGQNAMAHAKLRVRPSCDDV
jgi:hypothetical protein